MTNYQQTAKRVAKAAKNQIISSICDELDKVKESNSGVLKDGIISNLISQYTIGAPQLKITRHDIRNHQKKRNTPPPNNDVALEVDVVVDVLDKDDVVAAPRGNGGRPKGATEGKDFNCTVAIIAAKMR